MPNKSLTRYQPDTLDHVNQSDLVQLSRELLDAAVKATKILSMRIMTADKLKEAKVVLGFLNAATRTIQTKMQFFKMTGLGKKIEAVKKISKEL